MSPNDDGKAPYFRSQQSYGEVVTCKGVDLNTPGTIVTSLIILQNYLDCARKIQELHLKGSDAAC